MSKVLRVLDSVLGAVLLLMVVLAPWMLGATTRETIWALNGLGFLSGALWIAQRVIRNRPALPFGWGRNGLDWWL
jgi:hypothetical protein